MSDHSLNDPATNDPATNDPATNDAVANDGLANDNDQVRLVIDESACIGVGQCELLEAEVFELDEDSGLAVVRGPGLLPRVRADKVIDRCPSGAISIENP